MAVTQLFWVATGDYAFLNKLRFKNIGLLDIAKWMK
jgi:hypothetical protein